MRRAKLLKKISMVCVGADRVDSYEAEGYIFEYEGRMLAFVVEKERNAREKVLSVWFGEFPDEESALKSLRDVQYDLGRMNDRGFGCHEAIDF